MIPATVETRTKSLFHSKTFWAAIVTFWLAISPDLKAIAEQQRFPTPSEWIHIVTILISTGVAVYGRYSASTTVYTPDWMPGRNKPQDLTVISLDPPVTPSDDEL